MQDFLLFGSLVGNSHRRIGNLIPTLVVDQWKIPLYATVARNSPQILQTQAQTPKGPFQSPSCKQPVIF